MSIQILHGRDARVARVAIVEVIKPLSLLPVPKATNVYTSTHTHTHTHFSYTLAQKPSGALETISRDSLKNVHQK